MPAFYCTDQDMKGAWKKDLDTSDVIFEIDNKSITNRPDLWGHRGIAREFAAILGLPLKSIDDFVTPIPVKEGTSSLKASKENPLALSIENQDVCRRLAALYIGSAPYTPSFITMAHRLLKVESRPINAYVDMTNYVMLDIGQPMHAFDADRLSNDLVVRFAQKGEKLTLLDGQTIELTEKDSVISSGGKAVSLAGIMGGADTAISPSTNKIVIE